MRSVLAWLPFVLVATLGGPLGAQAGGGPAGPVGPVTAPDLPKLPKLAPGSPRDTLRDADRFEVSPAATDYPPGYDPASAVAPVLVQAWIPASLTGTGVPELIQYQLPVSYDPAGAPIPLLVAWHGFGASAASVAAQTTLDEWCDAYGWAYLSVTGLDDALFGTTPSQQNAAAAIDWMMNTHAIDRDRVYMVGFSLGAGIVGNFAARHRDPDGIMIAGLGLVSGSFDWVATWNNDPSVRNWLKSAWNFGGSPSQKLFAYRRAGDLAFNQGIPQPSPSTHEVASAMATNLHGTPTYITWDLADSIPYLPAQSTTFDLLLASMGTPALSRPVTGTVDDSTGSPATHSWSVLDEAELFAFLAPRSVQRWPASVDAQLDLDREVSWLDVTQAATGSFTWLQADVDVGARQITLGGVINAAEVRVDLQAAGLGGALPVRVIATSADPVGFALRLDGGADAPSYLVQSATGQIVQGVESDPSAGALISTVPGLGTADITTVHLGWQSRLWLTPDPASPGTQVTFAVEATAGSQVAWTLIGIYQMPTPIAGGVVLLVAPIPPALLFPVPLNPAGDALVSSTLPNDAALRGATLLLQAVIQGPGGKPSDASNVFRFNIE